MKTINNALFVSVVLLAAGAAYASPLIDRPVSPESVEASVAAITVNSSSTSTVQISNNKADRNGGGIYNTDSGIITLNYTQVSNNVAGADAYYNLDNPYTAPTPPYSIVNPFYCMDDVWFGNYGGNGGGIFNSAAGNGFTDITLNYSTVSDNKAFDGTHPVHRQSPPSAARSTRATRAPR